MSRIIPSVKLNNVKSQVSYYEKFFEGKLVSITPYDPEMSQKMGIKWDNDEAMANSAMHSEIKIFGNTIYAYDILEQGKEVPVNAMALEFDEDIPSEAQKAKDFFAKLLAEGEANCLMPLEEVSWGGYYGLIIDKYGVQWDILIYPFSAKDKN